MLAEREEGGDGALRLRRLGAEKNLAYTRYVLRPAFVSMEEGDRDVIATRERTVLRGDLEREAMNERPAIDGAPRPLDRADAAWPPLLPADWTRRESRGRPDA